MNAWRSSSCRLLKNSSASAADISHTSWIFLPPTVTARISGFRRFPPHDAHGMVAKYFSYFFALGIARRVFITAHNRFAGAFPIDAPARFAAVDGHVVDENLFALKAIQQHVARFLLQIFPRGCRIFAHMFAYRAKHLGVIIARCERRNAALVQRQRRVGNEQAWIDFLAAAEARAIGTGAIGALKLKSRGCSSSIEWPCSGHARASE